MNQMHERIERLRHKLLDGVERVLDSMNAEPRHITPPPAVERRALANTLELWNFCPQFRCRRARCCRGEPSHCLRIALPLIAPDALEAALPKRRRRPRRH